MIKKIQYQLEYTIRSSPHILFPYLSQADGLHDWFADRVEIDKGYWIFIWDGYGERAVLMEKKENEFVRFHWEKQGKNEFFEFRIDTGEITDETILRITDFCTKQEMKDQKMLWDSQVNTLVSRLGGL